MPPKRKRMFYSDPYEVIRHKGMTPPDEIFFDEEIHRFSANGKPMDKAGWYTGKDTGDLKVLVFGDWRMGGKYVWTNLETTDKRTKEYKQAQKIHEELKAKQEALQRQKYEESAEYATRIWEKSVDAPADHPYLQKKGIGPNGIRFKRDDNQDRLVLPLMNERQQIQTLQYIDDDGNKLFLPNGKARGGFFWIGTDPDEVTPEVLLICEGFATAASLHECTGYPVVVAFNLGNLKPVLQAVLPRFTSQTQVLLCADDDRFKDRNRGMEEAEKLAQEFSLRWVAPQWPDGSDTGTDFNDLVAQIGKDQVRDQIESVLDKPAEIPASWWKISEKGAISFSSQFAAESWVLSHQHRVYQHPDLWQFNGKVWERLEPESAKAEIRRLVCRGKGAEEGMLRSSHVEDTLSQSKMILQQGNLIEFDHNPKLLVFRNGTLDLDAGEFRKGQWSAEDHTTILRDYDYDESADCPRWKAFLEEVQLEKDTIQRLQEWCGYCLVPDVSLQRCLMLVGDGKNGKSVFLQTLREVIGSANVSSLELAEMFDRFKVGGLQGKLANICSDVDTNTVIHTSFKKIVAGEHTVAERKHYDPFEFQPFARILFSANKFNPTRDHSEGFYRRFDIVRFQRFFEDHERDPALLYKLRDELPGIFNWALLGLIRMINQNMNLTHSNSMAQEHEKFRLETHPFRGFLEECCEIKTTEDGDPIGKVEKSFFIEKYKEWCEQNGYRMQSTHRITADLAALGVEVKRAREGTSLVRQYVGVMML